MPVFRLPENVVLRRNAFLSKSEKHLLTNSTVKRTVAFLEAQGNASNNTRVGFPLRNRHWSCFGGRPQSTKENVTWKVFDAFFIQPITETSSNKHNFRPGKLFFLYFVSVAKRVHPNPAIKTCTGCTFFEDNRRKFTLKYEENWKNAARQY